MRKNFIKNLPIRSKLATATYVTYFVIVLLFLGVRLLSAFGLLDFMPSIVRSVVTTIFIQIILMFTICLFMFSGIMKNKPKDTLNYWGYKKTSSKTLCYAVILGFIVFFLNSYIASFFATLLEAIGFRSSTVVYESYPWWLLLLNIVFTALLPAVCEETAHRGLLLKGSLGLGATKAIIISAFLFGLLHMNIQQFFYATIIGLYLGYLTIHCDSIFPAIIIHFMNNALSTIVTYSAVNGLWLTKFLDKVTNVEANPVTGLIFNFVLLCLLAFGLWQLTKKLILDSGNDRIKDIQEEIYKGLVKQDYLDTVGRSKKDVLGQDNVMPREIFVDVEELFLEKNLKLGYMSKIDKKIMEDEQTYKHNFWTIATMTLSFVIGIAVTIFTLVWGLL